MCGEELHSVVHFYVIAFIWFCIRRNSIISPSNSILKANLIPLVPPATQHPSSRAGPMTFPPGARGGSPSSRVTCITWGSTRRWTARRSPSRKNTWRSGTVFRSSKTGTITSLGMSCEEWREVRRVGRVFIFFLFGHVKIPVLKAWNVNLLNRKKRMHYSRNSLWDFFIVLK